MQAIARRIPLALALFLAFQGLFALSASGRVNRVPDEFEVYLQAESIVERGSLAIPQCPPGIFFGKVGRDGKPYAPYGPGSAFLVLPHHLAGRTLAWAVGIPTPGPGVSLPELMAWKELVGAITSLASSTWAALAVVGLLQVAMLLGAGRGRALLLAVLLGGTTFLWPYGTFFYSEVQAAALLIWAIAFQLQGRAALAGVSTAVLILVKANYVILVPALLVLAAGKRAEGSGGLPRRLAPVLLGATAAGLIHLSWNQARFGSPLDFGYVWTEFLRPGEQADPFRAGNLPRGLFGLLLSPGKSVFLFAPVAVLGCARVPTLLRERPALGRCWIAAVGLSLLFYGAFFHWEGGYSFGPRHLLPILPVLLVPLALGPEPSRRAIAICAALGIAIQLLGVSVSFLEDQARGMESLAPGSQGSYYRVHPLESDAFPPGGSRLEYRLSYTPLVSYPPLLWGHVRSGRPGRGATGLDFLPLHLTRKHHQGATPLPLWLPWCLTLLSAGLLVFGVAGAATAQKSSRNVSPPTVYVPAGDGDPAPDVES